MSVKKDSSGRRSIQVEVEVPGTPEEVWKAIATGPGVSSWFVPTEIEEREGGAIVCHFGSGMDSQKTITEWEPPSRFAATGPGFGPGAPPLATEWIVEARSGGVCTVRVVHSLFADTDDWDNQLTSVESGWPAFFRVLRLSLTHFRAQKCVAVPVFSMLPESADQSWQDLAARLGIAGLPAGQGWETPAGPPPLAGRIERIDQNGKGTHALLMLDRPAPGIASIMLAPAGDKSYVHMTLFLYGEEAAAIAAQQEPLWRDWIQAPA